MGHGDGKESTGFRGKDRSSPDDLGGLHIWQHGSGGADMSKVIKMFSGFLMCLLSGFVAVTTARLRRLHHVQTIDGEVRIGMTRHRHGVC